MTLKKSASVEETIAQTPAATESPLFLQEKGGGGLCGDMGSNTPPYKEPEKSPSLAEALEAEREQHASALRFTMDRCCAMETLVEDLLDVVAAINPDAVGTWRDQSAIKWQQIIDGDCHQSEVSQGAVYQARFEILEAVMTRAGRPYEAAEVVDLAEARANVAVRRDSLN